MMTELRPAQIQRIQEVAETHLQAERLRAELDRVLAKQRKQEGDLVLVHRDMLMKLHETPRTAKVDNADGEALVTVGYYPADSAFTYSVSRPLA